MHDRQTCTIIPYTEKHIEDVSQIDRLSFIDPWFKRAFIEELTAPCTLNLVAVNHDTVQILGFCFARVIADECTINRLAVHPQNQRSGIATRLLEACLQRAGCKGACNCFIEVRAGNTAARQLYVGHGFSYIGTRNAYYQIGTEDAILMQCAIANHSESKQPE